MSLTEDKVEPLACKWQASMYENRKRNWLYGFLQIFADRIEFCKDGDSLLSLWFEDMVDVKKSTTGLVFGAVYVVKKSGEKIWFSSFDDREVVFGSIQHFWRSQLIGNDPAGKKSGRQRPTARGQKLLGIVQDSKDTLSKAATQLHSQGGQINSTLCTMFDIHNDLDVAEHLVADLEGWIGRWSIPEKYKQEDGLFVNKSEIPEVFEYEVIYTKLEAEKANNRKVGTLRISKDGLTLLTLKMLTDHHFNWGNVSQIHVLTPYEVNIISYRIGYPDLVYGLVCANMLAIIKILDKCAHHKLKYENVPKVAVVSRHKQTSLAQQKEELISSNRMSQLDQTSFNPSSHMTGQLQSHQSEQVVSEQEAQEISQSLSGLKSLALALSEEMSTQNETLHVLSGSVDKANQRLPAVDKKIKRLF